MKGAAAARRLHIHMFVMNRLFQRYVLSRLWLTFIVLGLSFGAFGFGTINLGFLLIANTRLLHDYGWQAVMDGALGQLVELVLTGYLSMANYVIFKTCEHRLSHWLEHGHHLPDPRHDFIHPSKSSRIAELIAAQNAANDSSIPILERPEIPPDPGVHP